jgi:hypothetical protein
LQNSFVMTLNQGLTQQLIKLYLRPLVVVEMLENCEKYRYKFSGGGPAPGPFPFLYQSTYLQTTESIINCK